MARKNQLIYKVAEAQSLAADFTTPPTLIKYLDNCAYQINVTTTNSIGSFAVEASLDYAVDETTNHVSNNGNWIPLTLAGGNPIVNAANDTILIDLNQLSFAAIRLSYDAGTAGTGVVDIYIAARQLGG